MNQIERIQRMEKIMDESVRVINKLEEALLEYKEIQHDIKKLEDYYHSYLWKQDYRDDEAGKIPTWLKRGVLSEDAVYNLLIEKDNLIKLLEDTVK